MALIMKYITSSHIFEYPMNKYIKLKIYTLQIGIQLHCNPSITTILTVGLTVS